MAAPSIGHHPQHWNREAQPSQPALNRFDLYARGNGDQHLLLSPGMALAQCAVQRLNNPAEDLRLHT